MKHPLRVVGIVASIVSFTTACLAAPSVPVVVIPGILGSKLCVKGDPNKVLWGNAESLTSFNQLRLGTGNDTQIMSCGIIDRIGVLGPFSISQYDDLLETLAADGYVAGQNLFVFDYDWRLNSADSAANFAEFAKKNIPDGRFDIVAHSMGGFVARIFIQQYDAKGQVRRLVEMGTPHWGAVSAFYSAYAGWDWWKNALAGGLGEVRATLLTFPSLFQLLPTYPKCCWLQDADGSEAEFNAFDPKVWEKFSWLPTSLRSDAGLAALEHNLSVAADTEAIINKPLPSSVQAVSIVTGVLVDTKWRVHVDLTTGEFAKWDDSFGDGTVFEWSAAAGDFLTAKPSDTEHGRIFANDSARTTLRWALVGDTEEHAGILADDKYPSTITTTDGQRLRVKGVTLELTPALALDGDAVTVQVQVPYKAPPTDPEVAPVVTAAVDGETALIVMKQTRSNDQLTFTGSLQARLGSGPTVVTLVMPGLPAPLQKLLVVLPYQKWN